MITPRTMPAFACCAMQSSYALLMIKSKASQLFASQDPMDNDLDSPRLQDMLVRVQGGLFSIMMTLENYGSVFEALGGMRG